MNNDGCLKLFIHVEGGIINNDVNLNSARDTFRRATSVKLQRSP